MFVGLWSSSPRAMNHIKLCFMPMVRLLLWGSILLIIFVLLPSMSQSIVMKFIFHAIHPSPPLSSMLSIKKKKKIGC